MFGLTVRWSLEAAPEGAAKELRDYVQGTSLDRFTGMPGLHFKTWRMREGEWFEGTYVWETTSAREAFLAAFTETLDTAPGTKLVGSPPVLIETFEVVAVAEGGSEFTAGPGTGE